MTLRTTRGSAVRFRCGSFAHAGSRPGFARCRRVVAGAQPRRYNLDEMEHAARTKPVLGLTLQEFAAPLAQLTDQEEMVISLDHPLVRVYRLLRA